jgi:WD40-like Beta Propeller Repeat
MRTRETSLLTLLLGACTAAEDQVATSAVIGDASAGGEVRDAGRAQTPSWDAATIVTCSPNCSDFPEEPIFDDAMPAISKADSEKFAAKDVKSAAFCLLEPQLSSADAPGALFPKNWLRPRFRWEGGASNALYEIKLSSAHEKHTLRAYTRKNEWTLPKDIWQSAAPNLDEVKVSVRALASDGTLSGIEGSFEVAPVEAGGSMVFWATTSSQVAEGSSKLNGFAVGDEAVIETLSVTKVETTPMLHENGRDLRGEYSPKPGFQPGAVQCIGCHAGTPDGQAVVFTDDYPWPKVVASITQSNGGKSPSYLTAGARALLKQPWLGTQAMSAAHWGTGDRILIASYSMRSEPFAAMNAEKDRLIWIDLETTVSIPEDVPATSVPAPNGRDDLRNRRNMAISAARGTAWAELAMNGETHNAVTPSFSFDGKRIAYVSTDKSPNGHQDYTATLADIVTLPYAERKGGQVEPLMGASAPDQFEYYPAFSPDDKYLAFTRAKQGSSPDGPYYNRNGEIYVIDSKGGSPERLRANDPPACSGEKSPGVLNSWPKWSPRVRSDKGKTYYFLIFSSARRYPDKFDIPRSMYTPATLDTRSSQLYMAAFVVDEGGKIASYPAVYLWNQNLLQAGGSTKRVSTSNLTPAWAEFDLPPVL